MTVERTSLHFARNNSQLKSGENLKILHMEQAEFFFTSFSVKLALPTNLDEIIPMQSSEFTKALLVF